MAQQQENVRKWEQTFFYFNQLQLRVQNRKKVCLSTATSTNNHRTIFFCLRRSLLMLKIVFSMGVKKNFCFQGNSGFKRLNIWVFMRQWCTGRLYCRTTNMLSNFLYCSTLRLLLGIAYFSKLFFFSILLTDEHIFTSKWFYVTLYILKWEQFYVNKNVDTEKILCWRMSWEAKPLESSKLKLVYFQSYRPSHFINLDLSQEVEKLKNSNNWKCYESHE